MNKIIPEILLITLVIFCNTSYSQVSIYDESFTAQSGKGVVGPAPFTYDTVGMTWTIDVSSTSLTASTDYFKVNASLQFESKDVDGEAVWYSPIKDISTVASVDLSVDVAETGNLAGTEYIRVYYKLDGGTETLFSSNGDNTDDFTAAVATHDSLFGSTVQIVVRTYNNAGTKTHLFDNVTVTENISNVQGLYDLPDVSSINLHWSNPVSDFDEVLVVGNAGSAISAGLPTGDGTAYTANSALGSGTSLLGGTVLYKGGLTTTNFTGVTSGNTYYVKVFTRKGTSWSKGYERSIAFAPPGVGEVLITEYARHASISDYSYIELYNTTASDISLAGAKMIVNNAASLSEVVDLSTDISGTIVVPANGFLILNRNRSQANFESTWGVDLANTGYSVNYNRTAINNFGNNKEFVLKLGGTEGADDGTIIDETKEFTGSTGKRVFQLPTGYWTGNIDDAASNATPGSYTSHEDLTKVKMAYSDGAWHAETGYAHSAPSAATGSTEAVVVRGEATFVDGAVLDVLRILPDAGVSISTETVTVNTGLYVENNASLAITSTGSLTSTGIISVEREGYAASSDYNAWGSPFATAIGIKDVFTNHNDCDFFVFKASDQSWKHDYLVGSTITCYGNSFVIASGNVIESPEGTPDGNFDVGRGYFIVGNTSNKYDFRKTSGASLNNGTITANIYGSSGAVTSGSNDWNLLSNPYPSAISLNSFLTTNSGIITNAVYLYNPGLGIDASASYTTINNTDGAHLASCQGFYVDASTTTDGLIGTASFTNSMRTNTNNNFRKFDSFTGIYLKATNAKNVSDNTRLYFDINAKDGRDRAYDAVKMENSGFNFASRIGTEKMVFNGLAELTTETKIIPLYFQTYETSNYTISIDSLLGNLANKDVLLEDKYMKTFHDLKAKPYHFTSPPKEWNNRFYLHVIHQKSSGTSGTGVVNSVNEITQNEVMVFVADNEVVVSSLAVENEIINVRLMNITGQVVANNASHGSTIKMDINTLDAGVYLVNYTLVDGTNRTQRIVLP
tara:strand:- start:6418 stop:9483 length:3066 start_codon:yes stop_codon:yes gene_type:complete